jgi:hypothetical protein
VISIASSSPYPHETRIGASIPDSPSRLRTPYSSVSELVATHSQLEILERRVQEGIDEVNMHPILVLNKSPPLRVQDATPEEEKAQTRYTVQREISRIPSYWEPRPWDSPDDNMGESDSEVLKMQLQEYTGDRIRIGITGHSLRQWGNPIPKKKERAKNNQLDVDYICEKKQFVPAFEEKPQKQKAKRTESAPRKSSQGRDLVLVLSSLLFDTDESDCATDYEMF